MRFARWILRAVDSVAAAAIVALVAALLVLVAMQFLDRYVIHRWQGFPAEEYIKVGIVWLCFIGFGLALRGGLEIRVDFLDQYLPPNVQRWIFGVFDLVTLALLAVILAKGARLYEISGLQMILGTEMTVAVPVLGMLLGCGLMALAILARFFRRVTGIVL